MIETLKRLCRLLSTTTVTLHDVAADLGPIVEIRGEGMGLVVEPAVVGFTRATVVPMPSTPVPFLVRFDLATAHTLSVAQLVAAFGPYREYAVHHLDRDPNIRFRVDDAALPFRCLVIVDVRPGPRGVADGHALAIDVRRDARLN